MIRFIFRNRILKIVFISIVFALFLYSYFALILKTDFNDFLSYSLNNRFKNYNNNYNVLSKMVYTSLNKIVDLNDSLINYEIDKPISDILTNNVSNIINTDDEIIYIYNTHDTEGYNLPFISDYSIKPTVKFASYILKDHLNNLNISSYVENNSISEYLKKNNLGYSDSYEASRYYLNKSSENKNFKIFIDIHRDSVKYDKTLYVKDNKKYAKVLFVLAKKNKNYNNNLKFINYINSKLNENFNGISRGILERNNVIFNQDISKNAILLEVGGVDNTIEEVNNTLFIIANILKEYINEGLIDE